MNTEIEQLIKVIKENFDAEQANLLIQELLCKERELLLEMRFKANLDAFKDLDIKLYTRFSNYTPKHNIQFIEKDNCTDAIFDNATIYANSPLEYAKKSVSDFINNTNILKVRYFEEKDYFGQIHYRYLNECSKILDRESNAPILKVKEQRAFPFFICLGLGLGYCLQELYSNLEINNLFVIEPNEDLFYASLYCFDYASLLQFIKENNYVISFNIGSFNLFESLRRHISLYGSYLTSLSQVYIHYENEDIISLYHEIENNYTKLNAALGFFDDELFGLSHGLKNILNKKDLVKLNPSSYNDFKDLPVFIIANGPSLDNDLSFLRKNQDKALIVACGTAIDSLYQSGIKADFYVSTERTLLTKDSLNIFDNNSYLDDIILITSNVSHESLCNKFNQTAIFLKKGECLSNLYCKESFKPLKSMWQELDLMNPFVSNTAISAFLELGFSNLYLFGVDNGTKSLDNLHSKASLLYTKGGASCVYTKESLQITGEGNFGGSVISGSMYQISAKNIALSILRQSTTKHKELNIVNCSDGLKIENTQAKRSFELDNLFDSLKEIDKYYIKNTLIDKTTFKYDINIEDSIDLDIYNKITLFISASLHKEHTSKFDYIQTMQNILDSLHALKDTKDEFFSNILEGSICSFFVQLCIALSLKEDFKESQKIALEIIEMIDYFLDDSKKLMSIYPNYIMGSLNYNDNKVGFDHVKSKAPVMPEPYVLIKDNNIKLKPFVKRLE